jgi:hypothetical protein
MKELLKKYEEERAYPVVADSDKITENGYNVIEGDVVNIQDYVRHDAKKLSRIIMDLTLKTKGKKISVD